MEIILVLIVLKNNIVRMKKIRIYKSKIFKRKSFLTLWNKIILLVFIIKILQGNHCRYRKLSKKLSKNKIGSMSFILKSLDKKNI